MAIFIAIAPLPSSFPILGSPHAGYFWLHGLHSACGLEIKHPWMKAWELGCLGSSAALGRECGPASRVRAEGPGDPHSTSHSFSIGSHRKGEGAFRQQQKDPSQATSAQEKYQLRETDGRLQRWKGRVSKKVQPGAKAARRARRRRDRLRGKASYGGTKGASGGCCGEQPVSVLMPVPSLAPGGALTPSWLS